MACPHVPGNAIRRSFQTCHKIHDDFLHDGNLGLLDLLRTCSKLRDGDRGRELHAEIADRGLLRTDPFLGSALVDMYAKCGLLQEAKEVFEMLPEPDVVTWTALIAGYAQHVEHGQASLVYVEHMKLQGIAPNVVTYTCSLKACSSIKAIHKGKDLHAMVYFTGLLESHPSLGSALVDMYAKCGHIEKAIDVFQELPFRDVVTWTALIGAYIQHDRCEEALDHLTRMQTMGISPNVVTYVCGLKACAKLVSVNIGEEIHAEIERRGFVATNQFVGNALIDMYAKCGMLADAHNVLHKLPNRDVVSWNALIAGYADNDYGNEAISCYRQMHSENISPDMLTFSSGLKACTSIVAMDTGMELHAEIERNGLLKEDVVLGSVLIDMYAKFGLLERAEYVFQKLPVRDEITWTTLMVGFAQLGEIENVFRIFDKMINEGKKPNSVGFLSILCACSHGGLVDHGWKYFEAMWENYNIIPILEHYACMVDLLARAGQLDTAILMIKEAPFHPDKGIWLTVLGACRKWGNTELGTQAFGELELLDDKNAASYVFMSNVYAC